MFGGVRVHAHRQPDGDPADVLLGNREFDAHRVEILQRRVKGSGRDVFADVDLRDADHAGERRFEGLLLQDRLQLVDLGVRVGRVGARDVEIGDRGDAAGPERLDALQRLLREIELGVRRREIGLLDAVVDLQQQLALLDVVVGGEGDLAHDGRRPRPRG